MMVEIRDIQPGGTRRERWEAFHRLNPHVYEKLIHYTRVMKAAGREKVGIRVIWERMRWDFAVETKSDDFKLNDHYTSFYARKIMEENEDLIGMFEIRERGLGQAEREKRRGAMRRRFGPLSRVKRGSWVRPD